METDTQTCCDLHKPGEELRPVEFAGDGVRLVGECCDLDCGPCCENCPTCPTLRREDVPRAITT